MPDFSYDQTITLACDVKDIDASIAWFKETLGFEETFKVPGWAEVSTPTAGVTIGLAESEAAEGGSGGATPVFGVTDIEAARAALEAKGVRFEGDIIEMPGLVKLTTFKDPDGNSYMFAQSLAGGD